MKPIKVTYEDFYKPELYSAKYACCYPYDSINLNDSELKNFKELKRFNKDYWLKKGDTLQLGNIRWESTGGGGWSRLETKGDSMVSFWVAGARHHFHCEAYYK